MKLHLIKTLIVILLLCGCAPVSDSAEVVTSTPDSMPRLNPSPTPSDSPLPLTCQITDLSIYVNEADGYCYAYPRRFTMGTQTLLGIPAVLGPAIGNSAEPVFASFAVDISAYDPAQSLDQQVDEFLKNFTVIDPTSFERARMIVGGEPAILVDQIPVQLSWRIVFVQHAGNVYRLMYWPVDVAEAKADIDELYQTTLGSFAFTNGAPMDVSVTDDSFQLSLDTGSMVTGFQTETIAAMPANDNSPYWEILPEYTRATLQGYPINNHLMKPQIFIYPAEELGKFNEGAGKVVTDLQILLQNQQAGEYLPFLPLFNAHQVMHTHLQYLDFKSGKGLRYLTWFSQGIMPINNYELIYTYQGLTSDGKYYVAAVLPVTHPNLPSDGKVTGNEPPEFTSDYQTYIANVVNDLNQQAAQTFTPDLTQLDVMLSSLEIK